MLAAIKDVRDLGSCARLGGIAAVLVLTRLFVQSLGGLSALVQIDGGVVR